MTADVVTLPDWRERAKKKATEPSEPHIPFERCQAVRHFLVLEAEWNSPRTSRSRRMEIINGLKEVAHPSGKDGALVLSPAERSLILQVRGSVPGWGKKKRGPRAGG